jgi:hypothetical protein
LFFALNNGDAIDCQTENPKPPRLADPEMGAAAEAILMASDLRNLPYTTRRETCDAARKAKSETNRHPL